MFSILTFNNLLCNLVLNYNASVTFSHFLYNAQSDAWKWERAKESCIDF